MGYEGSGPLLDPCATPKITAHKALYLGQIQAFDLLVAKQLRSTFNGSLNLKVTHRAFGKHVDNERTDGNSDTGLYGH